MVDFSATSHGLVCRTASVDICDAREHTFHESQDTGLVLCIGDYLGIHCG